MKHFEISLTHLIQVPILHTLTYKILKVLKHLIIVK